MQNKTFFFAKVRKWVTGHLAGNFVKNIFLNFFSETISFFLGWPINNYLDCEYLNCDSGDLNLKGVYKVPLPLLKH